MEHNLKTIYRQFPPDWNFLKTFSREHLCKIITNLQREINLTEMELQNLKQECENKRDYWRKHKFPKKAERFEHYIEIYDEILGVSKK